MPFNRSCFISYRPISSEPYRAAVEDFYNELEGEVLFWVAPLNSYVDLQRSNSNFISPTLATTLCNSVCMVVFYTPPYFDLNYTHCAREYKAMEELEAQRMALLGHTDKMTQGLIIPIVIRGWDSFPAEIKNERLCYNFQDLVLGKKISRNRKARAEITRIARYIFERYQELRELQPDPCEHCTQYLYPTDARAVDWLTALQAAATEPARPGDGFPRV